jgi:uncharacterized membrane protein YphA (DoxX/SURF4 family)
MQKILNLGRWIFPLSFLMYVGLHFGKPDTGADFVPDFLPFPLFWNYFTGICILAFVVSAVIGKYDKLAASLMALYVFLMIFLVHGPRAGSDELEAVNVFRNIMVTGALLIYARYVAKDSRVVG